MSQLIELDSRRRLALGRIGNPEHTRYLVDEQPDGTLVLTPAVVMSQQEVALLRKPELVDRLDAEAADPASWRSTSTARRPRKSEGE